VPLKTLNMNGEEAAIVVLLKTRQESLQGRLDIAHRSDCYRMSPSDVSGIDVDLNDLRPVGIELWPRKICSELEQHIAVKDSMIPGGLTDKARHSDIVGVVIRHKVFAPRGVGHRRLQPLGSGDHLVVRAGTAGAGIDRDRIAVVENGRDLVEVGVTRANDWLPGMDGIRPFSFSGRV
jgi:hypothetical protein